MGFEEKWAKFLDSTLKVGRPTFDDSDPEKSYSAKTMPVVVSGLRGSIQENRGGLDRRPGGKLEKATHDVFLKAGTGALVGDVVQATAGPESGRYFVVHAAYEPLTDHAELKVEESEAEKAWAAENPW